MSLFTGLETLKENIGWDEIELLKNELMILKLEKEIMNDSFSLEQISTSLENLTKTKDNIEQFGVTESLTAFIGKELEAVQNISTEDLKDIGKKIIDFIVNMYKKVIAFIKKSLTNLFKKTSKQEKAIKEKIPKEVPTKAVNPTLEILRPAAYDFLRQELMVNNFSAEMFIDQTLKSDKLKYTARNINLSDNGQKISIDLVSFEHSTKNYQKTNKFDYNTLGFDITNIANEINEIKSAMEKVNQEMETAEKTFKAKAAKNKGKKLGPNAQRWYDFDKKALMSVPNVTKFREGAYKLILDNFNKLVNNIDIENQ